MLDKNFIKWYSNMYKCHEYSEVFDFLNDDLSENLIEEKEHDRIDMNLYYVIDYDSFSIPCYTIQKQCSKILEYFDVMDMYCQLSTLSILKTNRYTSIVKGKINTSEFTFRGKNYPLLNPLNELIALNKFDDIIEFLQDNFHLYGKGLPIVENKAKFLSDYLPQKVSREIKYPIPYKFKNIINSQEIVETCRQNLDIVEQLKLEFLNVSYQLYKECKRLI